MDKIVTIFKMIFEKVKELINKLPFRSLAEQKIPAATKDKFPALKVIIPYTNQIVAILALFLIIAIFPGGNKSSEEVSSGNGAAVRSNKEYTPLRITRAYINNGLITVAVAGSSSERSTSTAAVPNFSIYNVLEHSITHDGDILLVWIRIGPPTSNSVMYGWQAQRIPGASGNWELRQFGGGNARKNFSDVGRHPDGRAYFR